MTMKLIAMLLVGLVVMAPPLIADTEADCSTIGKLAHIIMLSRQHNLARNGLEGIVQSEEDNILEGTALQMITLAYAMPVYESDSDKAGAAASFAAQWEEACIRVLSK